MGPRGHDHQGVASVDRHDAGFADKVAGRLLVDVGPGLAPPEIHLRRVQIASAVVVAVVVIVVVIVPAAGIAVAGGGRFADRIAKSALGAGDCRGGAGLGKHGVELLRHVFGVGVFQLDDDGHPRVLGLVDFHEQFVDDRVVRGVFGRDDQLVGILHGVEAELAEQSADRIAGLCRPAIAGPAKGAGRTGFGKHLFQQSLHLHRIGMFQLVDLGLGVVQIYRQVPLLGDHGFDTSQPNRVGHDRDGVALGVGGHGQVGLGRRAAPAEVVAVARVALVLTKELVDFHFHVLRRIVLEGDLLDDLVLRRLDVELVQQRTHERSAALRTVNEYLSRFDERDDADAGADVGVGHRGDGFVDLAGQFVDIRVGDVKELVRFVTLFGLVQFLDPAFDLLHQAVGARPR